jgi:methylated-DNA-[protein]-cysteine S-methyltransferase
MLIVTCYQTPIGVLEIQHDEHYLYRTSFSQAMHCSTSYSLAIQHQIDEELDAYFVCPHHRFNLSYKLQGSRFQRQVWNALMVIPSGQTITYGVLAKRLSTSPRAVGQACKTNPLPIFIPCHRVISQTGLGGYMGSSQIIQHKKALLSHEKAIFCHATQ